MFSSSNRFDYAGIAIPDYIELGWVCAPNTAGQTVAMNSLITLNLTTKVSDINGLCTLAANQFLLPAGVYDFNMFTRVVDITTGNAASGLLYLYNVTDGVYTAIRPVTYAPSNNIQPMGGRFKITSAKTFELRLLVTSVGTNFIVTNANYNSAHSNSTAGMDQRTTIMLSRYSENLITGAFNPTMGSGYSSYLEYTWRTAPNAAEQTIAANTLTECTLNTEVHDKDNLGVLSGNQIILQPGIYYFKASVEMNISSGAGNYSDKLAMIFNETGGVILGGVSSTQGSKGGTEIPIIFDGVIDLSVASNISFKVAASNTAIIGRSYNNQLSLSTANLMDRTRLQLWKK